MPKLRAEVLKVCKEFEKAVELEYASGYVPKTEVRIEAAENLYRARAAMATAPDLVAIYEQAVEWFRDIEKRFEHAVDAGLSDPLDLMRIKLRRLGIEIELANLVAGQGEAAQGKGEAAAIQEQVDRSDRREKKWVYKVRTYGGSVDSESTLNRMADQGGSLISKYCCPSRKPVHQSYSTPNWSSRNSLSSITLFLLCVVITTMAT